MKFPKARMKLKDIRFENGDGQLLEVCSDCAGSGEIGKSTKKDHDNLGKEVTIEKKVNGKTVKKLTGFGWLHDLKQCQTCKGAGTVVAQEAQ